MTAASVAATAGCSSARAAARTSARGTASARPRPSTSPRPCSARIARLERVDAVGRVRARVAHVERVGEPGAQVGAGRQLDQAVDRLDAELVVDELDDERHDRGRAAELRVAGGRAARCGS